MKKIHLLKQASGRESSWWDPAGKIGCISIALPPATALLLWLAPPPARLVVLAAMAAIFVLGGQALKA
jgi:hypothetical protein